MNRSRLTTRRNFDETHSFRAVVGAAQTLHGLGRHNVPCELLGVVARAKRNGFTSGESFKRRLKAARNVIADMERKGGSK